MEIKKYLKIGALALALAGGVYAAGNCSRNREIPKIEKKENRAEVKKNSLESAADLYEQQKSISEPQRSSYNEYSRKSMSTGEGALDAEVCLAAFLIALCFEKYLKRS